MKPSPCRAARRIPAGALGPEPVQLDVRGGGGFDPWDAPGIAGNVGVDPAGNSGATFGGDPLVNDTTFAGAQFLGTLDANGNVQVIGTNGVEFDSVIEIVSCLFTAAGLYFSYTGDAQGWFNA